jgi:hypothetical protein
MERSRSLWILGASIALAACAAYRLLGGSDDRTEARPRDHRDVEAAVAPSAPRGATSRVTSAPFDPARGADVAPVVEEVEEEDAPLPSALRRVKVSVAFDDGYPLAGVAAEAEPSGDDAVSESLNEAWADSRIRRERLLDAAGTAVFVVPRAARFLLYGGGDVPYAPFRTAEVPPEVAEAKITLPSNAIEIRAVDEAGLPVANLVFQANGSGGGGPGYGRQITGADGRAVFRGFVSSTAEVSVNLEDSRRTAALWLKIDGEPAAEDGATLAAPSRHTATVRRLPIVVGRAVDASGAPVSGATVEIYGRVAAHDGRVGFGEDMTGADGVFRIVVPRDGRTVAADAPLTEIAATVRGPNGLPSASLARQGRFDEGCDLGDVVIERPTWLAFRAVNAEGELLADAFLAAEVGGELDWDNSRIHHWEDALYWCARPHETRFLIGAPGFLATTTDATGAEAAPGKPPKSVVLSLGGTLRIVLAKGTAPEDVPNATLLPASPVIGDDGVLSVDSSAYEDGLTLRGLRPGVAYQCAFELDSVRYALLPVAPFAADETRTLEAPPAPARLRLAGRVVTAEGTPAAEVGLRIQRFGCGSFPMVTESDGTFVVDPTRAGPCRVEAWLGESMLVARDVELRAPTTEVELRLPPLRTATLRVFDVEGNPAAPDRVNASIGAQVETFVEEVDDGSGALYRVRAAADEDVKFHVTFAGTSYDVDAPRGRDAVEFRLPPVGAVVFEIGPSAVREELQAFATPVPGDEEEPVAQLIFEPSSAKRRSNAFRVRPGRRRIEIVAWDRDEGEWRRRTIGAPHVVDIRAGETTVVVVDH